MRPSVTVSFRLTHPELLYLDFQFLPSIRIVTVILRYCIALCRLRKVDLVFWYAMTLPRMPSLSTPQQYQAIRGCSPVALEKDAHVSKQLSLVSGT